VLESYTVILACSSFSEKKNCIMMRRRAAHDAFFHTSNDKDEEIFQTEYSSTVSLVVVIPFMLVSSIR
jgi:hypothetical protein